MLNPITLKPMSNDEINVYNIVTSKYLDTKTGANSTRFTVKANTCAELDRDLKLISEDLNYFRARSNTQTQIDFLTFSQESVFQKFENYDCRGRIEQKRLDDMANTLAKSAIKDEISVLGKSKKDTTIYIVLGSFLVLSTLLILLKNKK
jgi:hypothetical protein